MFAYMSKLDLVKQLRQLARDTYTTADNFKKVYKIVHAYEAKAREELYDDITSMIPPLAMPELIHKLATSSLTEKYKVLQSIPIVPVSVAASYLGVNESELHRLKYQCKDMFGARYLGRKCYSMEELQVIAQNPEWMSKDTMAKPQVESELPKLSVLDPMTFVDIEVAKAFTNLSTIQLSLYKRPSYRGRNSFRLSDLEEIRALQQAYSAT